ncbi:MAG: FtsW/RodA/SpoVE family cell cycle protein [Chitinophagales bacterium]|nr:FtsW/RodA/SpoVE family cell cycle protein [Chitinophagales bacterium]
MRWLNFLQGDKLIWLVVFLLIGFSLLGIYSSTSTLAFRLQGGNTEYYVMKQFFYILLGFGLMYATHLIDYRYYSRPAQILWIISIPLLIYTMYYGEEINSAKRWLVIPYTGFSIQTSDLAKLALIMYLARELSRKQDVIHDFKKAFMPLLIPTLITALLIAPENLSTALIVMFTGMIIMFIGRVSIRHIFFTTLVGACLLAIFFLFIFLLPEDMLEGWMSTWKHRVEDFVAPDEAEEDYQVLQSKIAIAKGGLINLNPGGSDQKNFLPHPYSDFIYSIIIEEYGLAGGALLLLLYLFFLYRCIRIVITAPKAFGAFLAAGLSIALVVQALINMAVAVNLLPVTGVTLPLVSMGGTSAVFTCIAIGIILSVSRNTGLQQGKENLEME